MTGKVCSIDGCLKSVHARGWCQMHYRRWTLNGDPLALRVLPFPQRFWDKVNKYGPVPLHRPALGKCWSWTAAIDRQSYGRTVDVDGTTQLAHRVSYRLVIGEIPNATPHLDHLCRNATCVNPDHLEPVTQAENNRRIGLATHCGRGHRLSGGNVYRRPGGTRECRACIRSQPSRQSQGASSDPAYHDLARDRFAQQCFTEPAPDLPAASESLAAQGDLFGEAS